MRQRPTSVLLRFMSTTLSLTEIAIINPTRQQTSAFIWRFYLPDES
jgi:hypothetical protein